MSSLSLVRYRGNDYSVPTAYGHHEVLVRGYVDEVVIWTLLKKVEASCDRYLIAGGTNVEAEWEQGPAI